MVVCQETGGIALLDQWYISRHNTRHFQHISCENAQRSGYMFQQLFAQEEKMQSLATASTALAIFIACMGSGGRVAYSVTQRTKEIGIRKALGASANKILHLLSTDFIKLILVAMTIALPLVWYAVTRFLEAYAYRITISIWIFLVPCLMLLSIAVLTVTQTLKASSANPVDALRNV